MARTYFQLMRDDVAGMLEQLGLREVTLVGHSMGGAVAYLVAMARPDRVDRLIIEDFTPPFPRDRAIPARPAGPLNFDWPVVPAMISQVNRGDPAAWDDLDKITPPTLLIGGGPESHIPQDRLAAVAARIPSCELVTIPPGTTCIPPGPRSSPTPCSNGSGADRSRTVRQSSSGPAA